MPIRAKYKSIGNNNNLPINKIFLGKQINKKIELGLYLLFHAAWPTVSGGLTGQSHEPAERKLLLTARSFIHHQQRHREDLASSTDLVPCSWPHNRIALFACSSTPLDKVNEVKDKNVWKAFERIKIGVKRSRLWLKQQNVRCKKF